MSRAVWASMIGAVALVVSGCAGTHQAVVADNTALGPGPATGYSTFYDDLAPYGEWIQVPPYGWCWTPYDVSPAWRPYTLGSWAYSDAGWTWVSNEPFGWAVYHYGRWIFDSSYGWVWVPGPVWAPAWVAWRYGDNWVGWAPLPPEAVWDRTDGLQGGDLNGLPDADWAFVHRREFLSPDLSGKVVSVARNGTILSATRDATRIEVRDGRPIDHGIDAQDVAHWTSRKIPRLQVVDARAPAPGKSGVVHGNRVAYFRPRFNRIGGGAEPPPQVTALKASQGPSPSAEAKWEARRQRMENSLAKERARLVANQHKEMKSPPAGITKEELARRHQAEQVAFEEHAAEQRRIFEQRRRMHIAAPDRAERHGPPAPHAKHGS